MDLSTEMTPNAHVEWHVCAQPVDLRQSGDTVYVHLSSADAEVYETRAEARAALGRALLDAGRYTDLGRRSAFISVSEQLWEEEGGEWFFDREASAACWTFVGDALLDGDSWNARWFERSFDPDTGAYLRRGVSLDGGETFAPLAEVPDGLIDRAWETFDFDPAPLADAVRAEAPATRRDFLDRYLSVRGFVVGRLAR